MPTDELTEDVEDQEVEAPEGELEEAEAPEAELEPYELPEDFAPWVKEVGGPDTLREAAQIYQALQTEEGVVDAFYQIGRALGFSTRELQKLFEEEVAAQGATLPAPVAGNAPVSQDMKQAETGNIEDQRVAAMEQRIAAFEQQQREAVAVQTIEATLAELGVSDEHKRLVVQIGATYLPDDARGMDPHLIRNALYQAKTEVDNYFTAKEGERLANKAQTKRGLPKGGGLTGKGGGGAAGGESDLPDYAAIAAKQGGAAAYQAAKARFRARMKQAGEYGEEAERGF